MGWTRITSKNIHYATAYCQYIDYSLLEKFIIDNEIVAYRKDIGYGTTVIRFFQNGGRACGNKVLQMEGLFGHPFVDHYMFFKTKNGEVIFTSQPYAEKNYIIERFNAMFSDEFELKIYDAKESWYYPGSVTLFSIKLKQSKR